MAKQEVTRRLGRRRGHLEVARPEVEWPEDLLGLLGQARDGYLAAEPPSPSPQVAAYLEVPAHGKVDGDGALLRASDPEPLELALLPVLPNRAARRPVVVAVGAAAALALFALGLRPMFTGSTATVREATTTSDPVPEAPTTAAATTVALDGAAWSAPATLPSPPPATVTTAALPETPTTVAPSTTGAPASSVRKSPSSRAKPAPATHVAPTTAAAPTTVDPAAAVLAYFGAANKRDQCVQQQGSGSTRAQVIARCGAEPVPPTNLAQYWAARDAWNSCATPYWAKHWTLASIQGQCGPKPNRADYGVPNNPY